MKEIGNCSMATHILQKRVEDLNKLLNFLLRVECNAKINKTDMMYYDVATSHKIEKIANSITPICADIVSRISSLSPNEPAEKSAALYFKTALELERGEVA